VEKLTKVGKYNSQRLLRTLQQVRQEEWINAKTHYIRIGKYEPLARMANPKPRTGPIAGSFYPTKTGDPIRQARNDKEREEACTSTHQIWMDNPPGKKNCHFLDLTEDEVGPQHMLVNPDKPFDNEAQWNYLEGLLQGKKIMKPWIELNWPIKNYPTSLNVSKWIQKLPIHSNMTVQQESTSTANLKKICIKI
jgi:hypothetical protein